MNKVVYRVKTFCQIDILSSF